MNHHDPMPFHDAFDARLRDTWRDAAAHLPGPLQLRLTPALAAQRRDRAHARGWLPALGACAGLALAIGLAWLPLQRKDDALGARSAVRIAADAAAARSDGEEDAAGLLARSPDFYAWLGSDEARSLALE